MQIVLVAVNAAVALLSGGSSLVGLVRPSVALAEGEQLGAGERSSSAPTPPGRCR